MILVNKWGFVLLFLFQLSFSQSKDFLVLDKETNLPIADVNIYYPNINEGTFTNEDGKASLLIKNNDLKISKIGYDDFFINFNELKNNETIYLNKSTVQLNEVVIKSFDLKKAINYVLDNYKTLYGDEPFEKECDFKEELFVDNKLKRLILTKVNWWGSSYKKRNSDNDYKLRLGAIAYSKNEPLDIFLDEPTKNTSSKSGYMETKYLVNQIYLNSFLNSFLTYTGDLHCVVEDSSPEQIVVSYESDGKTTKGISNMTVGKITFDKTTKAIISMICEIDLKDNIVKTVFPENKKEYTTETKSNIIEWSFLKNANHWSLNKFGLSLNFSITYENITHNSLIENSIYVLKETSVNKVNNDGLIDISKPFYQNLPSSNIITNSNSILLDEEENKFMNGK